MKKVISWLSIGIISSFFMPAIHANCEDLIIRGVGVGVRTGSYISDNNFVTDEYRKFCITNSTMDNVTKFSQNSPFQSITYEDANGIIETKITSVERTLIHTVDCDKKMVTVTMDYSIDFAVFSSSTRIDCSTEPFFEPLPIEIDTSQNNVHAFNNTYTFFEKMDTIITGDIFSPACLIEYRRTYGVKGNLSQRTIQYDIEETPFEFVRINSQELISDIPFEYTVFEVRESIIQVFENEPTFTQTPTTATIKCANYPDDQMINQVTAQDDCGTVTVSFTDNGQPDCSKTTTITRTWTATDACGQSTTAQTVITVLPDEEQPPASDCEAVELFNISLINQLVIDKVFAPNAILTVFKVSDFGHLRFVWSCSTDCFPQNLLTLERGNYRVNIRFYDENWRSICETDKEIFIGEEDDNGDNGDGDGGDDGDGDDGNNGNDGTTTEICNGVQISTTNKYISITGFGGDGVETKVFDANWNRVFSCEIGECSDPIQIDNVSAGKHFIIFKRYKVGEFGSLTLVCDELVEVTVGGGAIAPLIAATTEKQLPQLKDFQVSPNPANDYLYLELRKYRGEAVNIQVYDQLGNRVLEREIEEVKDDLEYISLHDFDNGVYFIKIHNPRYRAVTQRVVIARMY